MPVIDGGIVLAASAATVQKIQRLLVSNGYNITGTCEYGSEAIRIVRTLQPVLLILEYRLPDMTGEEVTDRLKGVCGFILITSELERSRMEISEDADVFCLTKPITTHAFINAVDLVLHMEKRIFSLTQKVDKLSRKLDDRIIIERAKHALMEKFDMTEEEAYRVMQKRSMDTKLKMVDIAKSIDSIQ